MPKIREDNGQTNDSGTPIPNNYYTRLRLNCRYIQKRTDFWPVFVFHLVDSTENDLYRWRCTNAGDSLSRYMLEQFNFLRSGSQCEAFDVMPFLLPLSFFCRQTWFQLALLGGGISLTFSGISAAFEFENYSVSSFHEYQLVANYMQFTKKFDGSCGIEQLNSLSFTLLWQGCDVTNKSLVQADLTNCSSDACISSISFRTAQIMDGFTVIPGNLSACVSALSLRLRGRDAQSDPWVDVGSSRFRYVRRSVRLLDGPVSLGPGALVFDYRAPLPIVFNQSWVPIICALCMIGISACGAAGHREIIRHLVLGSLALYSFVMGVLGCWFLAVDLPSEAFLPIALMASTYILALVLMRAERQLALGLIAQGTWALACRAVSECALHGDCAFFWDAESFSYMSVLSLAFGIGVLIFIRRAVMRAVLAVRDDAAAYDEAWLQVAGNPARRRVLRELVTFTSQLDRGFDAQRARHLGRRMRRHSASSQVSDPSFKSRFLRACGQMSVAAVACLLDLMKR